jgi:ribosomal protein S10
MLISKKFIHVILFIKKQKNNLFVLVIYVLKKKITNYASYLVQIKSFLKKKNNLSFIFQFKVSVLNNFFFNRIVLKIFDVFKNINVKVFSKFSCVNSKKKNYTILRSPFVYKKSKEQFFFERFKGFFTISLKNQKNLFFIDYIETVCFKLLVFPFEFKIVVKKIVKV